MQRNNLFPSYQQIKASIDHANEAVMAQVYSLLGLPNPNDYNTWLQDVVMEQEQTFMVDIGEFDYPDTSWICVDGQFHKFADLPSESERRPFTGHQIILYIDKRSKKLSLSVLRDGDMSIPIRFSKPQVLPFAGEFSFAGNFTGSTLSFPKVEILFMGAYADEAIAPEAIEIFSIASLDAPKAKEVIFCPQKMDLTLKNCIPSTYVYDRGSEGKVHFVNCNFAFLEVYRSCDSLETYTINSDNLLNVYLDGAYRFERAPKLSRLNAQEKPSSMENIEALLDSSILNNPVGDRYIALAVNQETPSQNTLPPYLEAKKTQLLGMGWTVSIKWIAK